MNKTNKHSDRGVFPSGCLLYTGINFPFLPEGLIDCKSKVDSAVQGFGDSLDNIIESSDLSALNKGCFDFKSKSINIKRLTKKKLLEICRQEELLEEIQSQLSALNLGDEKIKIDLGCMASSSDPCGKGDIYTLSQVFTVFKDELCRIKNQFINCCNGLQGTSGTSGTDADNGTSGVSATGGTAGTSGTTGTNGSTGSSGTSGTDAGTGGTSGALCYAYTVLYTGINDGTTVYWENCADGTPLSIFVSGAIGLCSRILPTADDSVEILTDYSPCT